jgi:hypothetical protein
MICDTCGHLEEFHNATRWNGRTKINKGRCYQLDGDRVCSCKKFIPRQRTNFQLGLSKK